MHAYMDPSEGKQAMLFLKHKHLLLVCGHHRVALPDLLRDDQMRNKDRPVVLYRVKYFDHAIEQRTLSTPANMPHVSIAHRVLRSAAAIKSTNIGAKRTMCRNPSEVRRFGFLSEKRHGKKKTR